MAINITPGPWTVTTHRDTSGAYIIEEARREQLHDGYDVSEEAGDRLDAIAAERDKENMRLIEMAPELYQILEDSLLWWDTENSDLTWASILGRARKLLRKEPTITGD